MVSRRFALWAIAAVVLLVALLGSEAQLIKTNKATFRSVYKWATNSTTNTPNPVNGAFMGAVVQPVVANGKAILSTDNALVQIDLTRPLNVSAPFYYRSYAQLPAITGAVRHGGVRLKISCACCGHFLFPGCSWLLLIGSLRETIPCASL
jgi:hypothetical protein